MISFDLWWMNSTLTKSHPLMKVSRLRTILRQHLDFQYFHRRNYWTTHRILQHQLVTVVEMMNNLHPQLQTQVFAQVSAKSSMLWINWKGTLPQTYRIYQLLMDYQNLGRMGRRTSNCYLINIAIFMFSYNCLSAPITGVSTIPFIREVRPESRTSTIPNTMAWLTMLFLKSLHYLQ